MKKKEKNFDTVEKTLMQLAHLSLGVDDAHEGPSNVRQQNICIRGATQHQSAKKANFLFRKPNFLIRPATFNFRPPDYRNKYRYRPYVRPRKKCASLPSEHRQHMTVSNIEKLSRIKLEKIEDVDELKLTLLLSPTNSNRCAGSCSIEASRCSPVDEGVAGEVAELAEYFSQFVAMKLKMSPLAESMYV